jgi:hypothetical protein
MKFDDAQALCETVFIARHPPSTWPSWLAASVTRGGTQDGGDWVVSYTLAYKEPLNAGEYWREIGGRHVLCKTEPKTGKERVIIHRRASVPPLVLFAARVDARTGAVTVLTDEDITTLNADDFEAR